MDASSAGGSLRSTPATQDTDTARQALLDRSLLEWGYHPLFDLTFYEVPPIVRELLRQPERTAETLQELHACLARYHEFQSRHVTRQWNDDLEAVFHYRQAVQHDDADRLAESIASFYYRTSQFTAAVTLVESIVERSDPHPPWWALNRFGMCQLPLGKVQTALDAFERALPVAPDARSKGTTLNNISQIFKARGDYETALSYLEQSLQISREIGDKSGMIPTLHNMAHIALQNEDGESAMSYWGEALQLATETGNAQGIFHVAGTLGTLLAQSGGGQQAAPLLQMAIDAGRQAGFPGVEEYETILQSLTGGNEQ